MTETQDMVDYSLLNENARLQQENEMLRKGLLDLSIKASRPPVVMMEPAKVVEKYHDLKREHNLFVKIIGNLYWHTPERKDDER